MAIAGLIFFATITDLFTLIPLVGDFVAPVYWILVSIYLYFKGFGILNARRLVTSILSMVTEMIPVVQEFPLLLAGTIAIIIFSRMEDKLGTKLKPPTPVPGRNPLNSGGVRKPVNLNSVRKALDVVRQTDDGEDNPMAA